MKIIKKILLLTILFFVTSGIYSQSVVNSVHNLSAGGIGNTKSSNESEICIFCHTPHNGNPKTPMWNKKLPGKNYILYNSSTIQAQPGQPDGSSALCLSCHDGTIALGNLISRDKEIDFSNKETSFKHGKYNLTTDLSDDHIISFLYNSSLSYSDGELKNPSGLTNKVKLEKGKVQCTSCHDPHNNTFDNFLVKTNRYSELCITCHDKRYWFKSSHETSAARWNGSGKNPWFHTKYETVAENACENCHNTHSANGHERLLKYEAEENNCLDCHNGNVASKNIQRQLNKPYSHNVYSYNKTHDAAEKSLVMSSHVECEDCHNPHSVRNTPAKAPFIKGYNNNVKGIDINGTPVLQAQYEYEICLRCHGDSPSKPASAVPRIIEQNNVRLEFALTNPSFHPVAGQGVNTDVPSLISPYDETSVIYCTDCHSSDGKDAPGGPHGSVYPYILKYNYTLTDYTPESFQAYELCYQCHDRNTVINGDQNEFQRKIHKKHIVEEKTPCGVCHDSHGISSLQGNSVNNSNLINFNRNIVKPVNGILRFEDTGLFSGTCYLSCHGKTHNPLSYK